MSSVLTQQEFDLLRKYIEEECGIAIADGKEYLIESRLANLMAVSGSKNYHELYLKASRDKTNKFRDKIVDAITTNETSWFRDMTPYTIIQEKILPEFLKQLVENKKYDIRIWSAASSTGQEAYSIAMIINEFLEKPKYSTLSPVKFNILGTDISSSALMIAKLGRFDHISMSRGMPALYKQKYFDKKGRVWILKDKIKKMVTFKKFNLQNSFQKLRNFDIILCRNVAIYFSDSFKRELFKKMAGVLKSDGYFFLGSAESISNYSNDFEMLSYKKGIYYKLK